MIYTYYTVYNTIRTDDARRDGSLLLMRGTLGSFGGGGPATSHQAFSHSRDDATRSVPLRRVALYGHEDCVRG